MRLCRCVGNPVCFKRSLCPGRPQRFCNRLRADALIPNTVAGAHVNKSQIVRQQSANACCRPQIYDARIRRCKFQKRNNRRPSQIRRLSSQRNGMGVYIILPRNVMLDKIDTVSFLNECSSLSHRWQLMLVNTHGNSLGGRHDPIMIFRKIPQCLIRSHVNSISKQLTDDNCTLLICH